MEGFDSLLKRDAATEEFGLKRRLKQHLDKSLNHDEWCGLKEMLRHAVPRMSSNLTLHGLNRRRAVLRIAVLFGDAVDADRNILLAILLHSLFRDDVVSAQEISDKWGQDVATLVADYEKVLSFGRLNSAVNAENYRGLLLTLASDIRVIIIMIVRNLAIMRMINHHPDEAWVKSVAFEAECLYAQLAHRLGLYALKGELEDLALKYTNRDIYTQIAHKLNETKRGRDAYIQDFINPVKDKLHAAGLTFDIKGRTKSISSIWAKMKKQKVDLQHIYDLFAIRVIIDTPLEREKQDCWLAYSIVTDMYTANPARMKDWISLPKSNGYESLHSTVMGPDNKWVEVQIRTKRMDLVAEKGLAAHWRYKGVKGDSADQWMNNVRDILETADAGPMELMKNMRSDSAGKEVFAFTPKGDLFRMQQGATVLDFAFLIHSNVGSRCIGAIVNGRHEKITYKVKNGDTIEIQTSATQTPKLDWLNLVVTSKARNKIRQTLNDAKLKAADLGKELLQRRARNRKIDIEETLLTRLIKRQGYKFANDFYADLSADKVDVNKFLTQYAELLDNEHEEVRVSAEAFRLQPHDEKEGDSKEVLMIGDKSIKGLNYKFARCCSPLYGDKVFGFVSSDGTVKIHKSDCPNAINIRSRYPYRIIEAAWRGDACDARPVTLKVTGNDDIGILTNITSVISKEPQVSLRNITVDSHDNIFEGFLTLILTDSRQLAQLVRKLKTIKGVKDIVRS